MAKTAQNKRMKRKEAVLEALRKHNGIIKYAEEATGVPRRTIYNWIEDDAEFAKAVEECADIALDFVEDKLYKRIMEGDTTATIFYLKTKGKRRGYVEKQEIEHSAKDGLTIVVKDPEQKEKITQLGELGI